MSVHSDALMSSELECCHLGIDHLGQINVWLMCGGSRGVLDAVRRDPLGRPQKKNLFRWVMYFILLNLHWHMNLLHPEDLISFLNVGFSCIEFSCEHVAFRQSTSLR